MAYQLSRTQAGVCIKEIRRIIQQYFKDNHLKYAIFGKSEGLDSSVIAGLLSNLEGVYPIGVIMPCESNPEVERIGALVLNHFNIPSVKIDLTHIFHSIMGYFATSGSIHDQLIHIMKNYDDTHSIASMSEKKKRAAGNIKVRLRMVTLYHLAQLSGGLVISTDNLSELWMGFWTINGDVGDLSPIQNIWKGIELYTIAQELNVPNESIQAPPSDGLELTPGGIDEDQLGLPYHELDRVIIKLLQNKFDGTHPWAQPDKDQLIQQIAKDTNYSNHTIAHIANQLSRTHFKRNWPIMIERDAIQLPDIESIDV